MPQQVIVFLSILMTATTLIIYILIQLKYNKTKQINRELGAENLKLKSDIEILTGEKTHLKERRLC